MDRSTAITEGTTDMAGYVSLSSMPSPKKEYVVSFENLAGGLNLQELDYRIDNNETPEMKNLLWREGVLSCRDGQVWVDDNVDEEFHAAYTRIWNGKMFRHSDNKLYAIDPEDGVETMLYLGGSDMDQRGSFFLYNEKLYYKTKGYYIEIAYEEDQDTFIAYDVEGYTPTTYINCDPDSGAGTVYQPENRISAKKELWYNAGYTLTHTESTNLSVAIEDSYFRLRINTPGTYTFSFDGTVWNLNSTAVDLLDYGIRLGGTPEAGNTIVAVLAFKSIYQLPVKGSGLTVTKVIVDGEEKELTVDYTVDAENGTVTFLAAPTCYYPEINNTVRITYSLENSVAYNNIMDCTYAEVYGGTGSLCVVMAGSSTQPNAYFWNGQTSVAMDPAYFPMTQYQLAGDGVDPITGFGKQQGYLIIFKERSVGRTTLETQTVDERLTIDLPYTAINAKIGCDLPFTIQLIENNLVWCNKSQGVHFLANTSSAYENNIICLSQKVNDSSGTWTNGLLTDVQTSDLVVSHDDDKRYWLVAGGHVWLWDYYVSNYKNPSWFYFDNINGEAFIQEQGVIWHFDGRSRLTRFDRCYYDYYPDEDRGAIDKVFRFATQYFGTYDNLKMVNSVIINTRSDTNTIIDLKYITDCETRDDLTPLVSVAWVLVPRNLTFRTLKGSGFAHVFRRKPHCRRVHYFTMRLENNQPLMDLSVVSAQIYYIYQGRFR